MKILCNIKNFIFNNLHFIFINILIILISIRNKNNNKKDKKEDDIKNANKINDYDQFIVIDDGYDEWVEKGDDWFI